MYTVQKLYAQLLLAEHNMRMLHWNVYGDKFDNAHARFDEYVKKLGEFIDEVAEIMKMEKIDPMDLLEALNLLESDNVHECIYIKTGASFTCDAAFLAMEKIFMELLSSYRLSKQFLPEEVHTKLDEHIYYLRLELRYKNNARTGGPEKE